MRNPMFYAAIGLGLVAGASVASAQTVIAQRPGVTVIAQEPLLVTSAATVAAVPVTTVETVRTVRRHTRVARRVVRPRHANRHRTRVITRTIVRERIVRVPVVVAAAPTVAAVVPPGFTEVVPAGQPLYDVATPASRPLYDVVAPQPLYDTALPAAGVPPATAVAPAPFYRYVYQPGRILVVDPYTNIAIEAIPR